ncbi:MATE family efflux transporter [Clostridium estertheticum]|uniref:MATE family efflux transporter n=1 Tax=Clostridium estertheticum TaxID=238834 RepID=UPI001C7DABB0|nr:MATE family efflux transporter [Clostridium estertheticum]MBX4260537.1 MATE family efflux transporter [Clostridium estertheticum]WLC71341.1 MATE family efflux transporter [Clostridium estertheticum]
MQQHNDLTKGKVIPTLLRFAFPFLLASLLQALYGAADLLVVGQFDNSAQVSAVATGSQIMQTITGVILGLTTGGTIIIGNYLGAKKYKDIAESIGTIICIFAIMAAAMTVIMVLLTGTITSLMNTPAEAFKYTKQYIFICSCGIPFIIGYNALSGILRGLGNSKAPLYFITVACVTNIFVDLILVGVLHMGAPGAAIATILAQAISFIIGVVYVKKVGFVFEFNRSNIKLESGKAKRVFKLGLPIALQDGLINVSFIIITAVINVMGLTASASVGVVEKIIVFTMLPTIAFASAIAAMTAQNMGAGKQERAKQCLYIGMGCSLIIGIICYIYVQINPTSLTALFSRDVEVIKTAALYLKSYSIDCILVCFVFCMNSFFSGCGNSLFPMIHSLISTFFIRIPLSFVLSKMAGITLYEIGFASPLATFASLVMCIIYLRSGRWKKNKIITQEMI